MNTGINKSKTAKGSRSILQSGVHAPDINVTPFVDVLLVLLIIFMAASPALVSGLNINLPKGQQNNDIETKNVNITITIDNQNLIYVNDKQVNEGDLLNSLNILKKDGSESIVFLRGDKNLVYDKIMSIVNLLAKNNFDNIVLVTEHE